LPIPQAEGSVHDITESLNAKLHEALEAQKQQAQSQSQSSMQKRTSGIDMTKYGTHEVTVSYHIC
jgi:hypothetical protein